MKDKMVKKTNCLNKIMKKLCKIHKMKFNFNAKCMIQIDIDEKLKLNN